MAIYSNDQIKVRDYLKNKYGSYGITDADIGWDQTTGTVLLKGDPFIKPDQLINDRSWASQSAVDTAFTNFAQQRGMTPNTYQSSVPQYAQNIDELLASIMSPEQFAYDPESDPAYQAIKAQNDKLGDTSMINTMAEASSMSGGRLNSWATTAGMQQKQAYDQNTLAAIPQLQNMAYDRYRDSMSDRYSLIELLQGMDNEGYDRWNNDRLFNRDVIESDRGYQFDVDQANRDQSNWEKEFAFTEEQSAIDNAIRQQNASKSSSSGGGLYTPQTQAAPVKAPANYPNSYTINKDGTVTDSVGRIVDNRVSEQERADMFESFETSLTKAANPYTYFMERADAVRELFGLDGFRTLYAMIPKAYFPKEATNYGSASKTATKSGQLE